MAKAQIPPPPPVSTLAQTLAVARRNLALILVVLLVLTIAISGYLFFEVRSLKADPTAESREEAEELVAEIGKLIVLPEGEVPTVATVSDPERLQDQPFFANAQAGDKVLLYTVAKKAYLYDPRQKKLLEVAPINVGGGTEAGPSLP